MAVRLPSVSTRPKIKDGVRYVLGQLANFPDVLSVISRSFCRAKEDLQWDVYWYLCW